MKYMLAHLWSSQCVFRIVLLHDQGSCILRSLPSCSLRCEVLDTESCRLVTSSPCPKSRGLLVGKYCKTSVTGLELVSLLQLPSAMSSENPPYQLEEQKDNHQHSGSSKHHQH